MSEHGGATTQDGIFYQNTVAARYLADLLDLSPVDPRERVVEVRLEAPSDVDDIVVRFADGHGLWIQAKTRLSRSGDPWTKLWQDFAAQALRSEFSAHGQLLLVLGDSDKTSQALRDLTTRAGTAASAKEWIERLGEESRKVLESVRGALPKNTDALELLRRTTVEISSQDELERAFERRRLGTKSTLPPGLHSILRDVAGGNARQRALVFAAPLRQHLLASFKISVTEPAEWGLPAYRAAIERLSRIEIPATRISGSSADLFVWPRARDLDRSAKSDFEDEDPSLRTPQEQADVDLKTFPSAQFDRAVIVAGPGHGKSALLNAVAARLASTPYVPAIIPLATFAASDIGITQFLTGTVNLDHDVRVDWMLLAERGLSVILFDGLDEIPARRRPVVLDRIKKFSARYPSAPWLLSVRDPAVLSAPADARLVELQPLDQDDIARFVKTLEPRVKGLDQHTFMAYLDAHPDVARLARIPLFLAMLLGLYADGQHTPTERVELIESYLKTLFSPEEHKALASTPVATPKLRKIAESLAYSRLAAQEIGATEGDIRKIAGSQGAADEEQELILNALASNGVLRRQSSIRLQFPYPIVQEYLAACYLVGEQPDSLSKHIDDAIQRPWAQVIQFALELHADPDQIIRQMLERREDAFFTGLRLVARCIANGAKVAADLKNEIATRLANVWASADWLMRERVGRLMVDAFSEPLIPSVREKLSHAWLISSGAGEIIVRAKDIALTREVLSLFITHKLERFMQLSSLQPAINELGDEALNMYASRIRGGDVSEDQISGLASLVRDLNPKGIDEGLALALARDDALPVEFRLSAFSIAGTTLNDSAWPVINFALHSSNNRHRWSAQLAISHHADPSKKLLELLKDETLDAMVRAEIADHIPRVFTNAVQRTQFFRDCTRDKSLPTALRGRMLAFSARYGDREALQLLVDELATLDLDLAGTAVSLLGHFSDRQMGIAAATAVRARVLTGDEVSHFARDAATGMLSIFEMDSYRSGVLMPREPHPATPDWAHLAGEWLDRDDLTELQRLSIAVAGIKLGSTNAAEKLVTWVAEIRDVDDVKFNDDDYGHTLRSAIDELTRLRRPISLEFAEHCVRAKRPNLPIAGIYAIAAYGDRRALDLLVRLHNDGIKRDLQSMILSQLEPIASRFGLAILNVGGRLEVA